MLLKMAEWTGLFMKVHPASHITNFPAKVNCCANLQATGQALNLNTQDFENSLFYLSIAHSLLVYIYKTWGILSL